MTSLILLYGALALTMGQVPALTQPWQQPGPLCDGGCMMGKSVHTAVEPIDVPAIEGGSIPIVSMADASHCPIGSIILSNGRGMECYVTPYCSDKSRYLLGPNGRGEYICHRAQP